ncbi:MAG: glycosyltransferase family 2 protein [Bacteroidales bacterium]|nr:glycosyltransferase family 2 protein [Bacteroidales bacterium]
MTADNKPIISIVLPVYNGERYIGGAIDSVLAQTMGEWELLVIDDGSTDGSPAICDAYAARDARIRVFHQPNGGVNSARAKGVDNASGEYVTFLDADDSFTDDALEAFISRFDEETDIVSCGGSDDFLDRTGYLKRLWSGEIKPGVCGKMFRTAGFKGIDYRLERRMAMGEDLLLNSVYAINLNKARTMPRDVYLINRDNDQSVTKTFRHSWEYEKYYFSKVEELFLSKCRDWDSYDEIKLLVGKSWLNAMKYVMLDGGSINYVDHEFKAVRDYFKERKQDLGPSERMIFSVRNSFLYRNILKAIVKIKGR